MNLWGKGNSRSLRTNRLTLLAASLVNLVDIDGSNGVATLSHLLFEKKKKKTETENNLTNRSKNLILQLVQVVRFIQEMED